MTRLNYLTFTDRLTLEPLVLALFVINLFLGVFPYAKSISDVIFYVQIQDQMLKVRQRSKLTSRRTTN